jgi:hypothetical protein
MYTSSCIPQPLCNIIDTSLLQTLKSINGRGVPPRQTFLVRVYTVPVALDYDFRKLATNTVAMPI